jgi:hypothetical protein
LLGFALRPFSTRRNFPRVAELFFVFSNFSGGTN